MNSITGDGLTIVVGSVIQVDDEQMIVTGIAGDVLTVIRGYNSTIADPHAIDAAVSVATDYGPAWTISPGTTP